MKYKNTISVFVPVITLLVVLAVGCGQTQTASPVPNSIVISPGTATVTLEATQTFTAIVYDQNSNVLAVTPSWQVVGSIGTIATDGLFTATAEGTGIIRAAYEGISGEATVTVAGNFFPHEVGYSWTYTTTGVAGTRVVAVTGTSNSVVTGETIAIFNDTQKNSSGITTASTDTYYKVNDLGVYYYGYNSVNNSGLSLQSMPFLFGMPSKIDVKSVSLKFISSTPMELLLFPLSVGKQWTSSFDSSSGSGTYEYDISVVAFEDVTVPAGTFKCYKIKFVSTYSGTSLTSYVWYGNNGGQVKVVGSTGYIISLQSKNF